MFFKRDYLFIPLYFLFKYSYDKRGNISEVRENGHLTAKYTYDNLNRLVREDNKPFNKTVLFTYDTNGNIIERCEYAYTLKSAEELSETECTHFSYDYDGDRLIVYNGQGCAYNNLGSPTTYRGKSATWKYGKLLTSYNGNTFEYDCLGNRSAKNGIGYAYNKDGNIVYSTNGLTFYYAEGDLVGFKYQNKDYFYRKDAQGNVIALLDNSGRVLVQYKYDARQVIKASKGKEIEQIETSK